VKLEEKTN